MPVSDTYAVASALDAGAFPAELSDMDNVYSSLDLLNYGSPEALQLALKQLGGESDADYGYMRMAAARLLLDVMHQQMRRARLRQSTATAPSGAEVPFSLAESSTRDVGDRGQTQTAACQCRRKRPMRGACGSPLMGRSARFSGDASTHTANYVLHGFAVGGDVQFAEDFLAGVALSTRARASRPGCRWERDERGHFGRGLCQLRAR